MADVILIPWRGGQPNREAALKFVHYWYSPLDLPIIMGDSGHDPFNRGASRNTAAKNAGLWEVALIADADCFADLSVVRHAMAIARTTGELVIPHDNFWRLSKQGTRRLLTAPALIKNPARLADMRWGKPKAPSGALVISRTSFEKIGGYDEKFKFWGQEDTAFLWDAADLVGVRRLAGPLYHLWHPRDGGHNKDADELMKAHPRPDPSILPLP